VDLLERQVFIVHGPISGLAGLGVAAAGGGKPWVPTLWIDGESFAGKGFEYDESGGGDKVAAKPSGGLGGVLDAFDTGGDAAAPKAKQFVAESLEFEIKFPGGRKETTRRVLCDRGGAAWRKCMPLSPQGL